MNGHIELSENQENYLEVILDLEKVNKVARAKDIAERLNIQRGSVTGALKNLSEKGLINYEPYKFITLTQKGKSLAKEITNRHAVLKDFLINILQIDYETADQTACRMEHTIDKKTKERLVCFIEYIQTCSKGKDLWAKEFMNYCRSKQQDKEMKEAYNAEN